MVPKWPLLPTPLTAQNHRLFPPKNEAAKQSPSRFGPNQRVRRLIVMSLGGGIKQNSQNCAHGANMATVTYPPSVHKNHRFTLPKNEAAKQSPGRFRPNQRGRRLIVMMLGGGIKQNG